MIKEQLMIDLKEAMKNKETIRKNTIQMTRAAILQIEKDQKKELDDKLVIEIVAKEVKKRKDSIEDYTKGGREDLVLQINEEIEVLNKYLPKQIPIEEIETIIKVIIVKTNATSIKDMGAVMKMAKEEIGAASDGKTINEVVRKLLK